MAVHLSSDRRAHHQLLRLVDNYADEELIRERAIEELRNKRTDLASEFESATTELEQLKENRLAAEEEVRELRVELETLEAAVNFKQAKLSSQKQEISKTNTLLKKLEDDEMGTRDSFITTMMEINTTVRKMQSANCGPPLQVDYQSARGKSANLDNYQSCCKTGIAETSASIINEAVRQEQVSELLQEIDTKEELLLTIRTNLDTRQEKLQDSWDKEEAYIESIGQDTRDLASTRNQSEELENLVASLTTDLQDLYVCPQCGTDNIGESAG